MWILDQDGISFEDLDMNSETAFVVFVAVITAPFWIPILLGGIAEIVKAFRR